MKLSLPKPTFWTMVLAFIWILGIYSAFTRFYYGLGTATNLSDQFPWGIWIGFDILVGVGLAAGGFVVAATVYIFNLKSYKPIARSTILTAFLGYLLVIGALLFDLGKPYNVWHPLVMWNPHSVMFEVGWCVMLYTTVLFLEFLPVLFERFRLERPLRIIRSITVPLVIVGVLLSTLHQSSLGTLYVIVPDKLHPLWYSGILPLFFFISAVAGGLAMVIFESYLSARAFGKELEFKLLSQLSRIIVVVLSLYLLLRLQDMGSQGALKYIFDFSTESIYFLIEVGLGVVLPILLFLTPRIRNNTAGLFLGAVFVLTGFVMNRLNVAITGMTASAGVEYIPSWMEVAVTASIVAAGIVIFRYAAKYLPIFSDEEPMGVHQPPLVAAGKSGKVAMGILGVILLAMVIGLGIGLTKDKLPDPGMRIEAAVVQPAGSLKLPDPIVYEMGESSPGAVTFSHENHVDPSAPQCKTCHSGLFKMRPEKAGALGSIQMDLLYEKKQCGVCHDGEQAFNVEDNCEVCHVAAE